ncbi:MAG: class IV adenylate cyclase [Candidatus Nomurabacteria bacterium]|nr:class IV adenylate cyclase [Candidatus Nomurabacteria bacterium]
MAKIEIEYKYPLKNPDAVVGFLDKKAKLKYESHQVDTYFDSETVGYSKDLENGRRIDQWLRVREEDGKASINFKDYGISDNDGYCTELESDIAEPADVKGIVERMGFLPAAVVDKKRRAYAYKGAEVAVDTVADLGSFIEVEYYGENEDIDQAKKLLEGILDEVGAKLGDRDKVGYPYHLIKKSRVKS